MEIALFTIYYTIAKSPVEKAEMEYRFSCCSSGRFPGATEHLKW